MEGGDLVVGVVDLLEDLVLVLRKGGGGVSVQGERTEGGQAQRTASMNEFMTTSPMRDTGW